MIGGNVNYGGDAIIVYSILNLFDRTTKYIFQKPIDETFVPSEFILLGDCSGLPSINIDKIDTISVVDTKSNRTWIQLTPHVAESLKPDYVPKENDFLYLDYYDNYKDNYNSLFSDEINELTQNIYLNFGEPSLHKNTIFGENYSRALANSRWAQFSCGVKDLAVKEIEYLSKFQNLTIVRTYGERGTIIQKGSFINQCVPRTLNHGGISAGAGAAFSAAFIESLFSGRNDEESQLYATNFATEFVADKKECLNKHNLLKKSI